MNSLNSTTFRPTKEFSLRYAGASQRQVAPIPLVPKAPIWGRHLQTTHLTFRRDHPDVSALNPTPIRVPMDDGTGDVLTGVIHTPSVQRYPGLLVVAGHGFGGEADSVYMRLATRFFYDRGIAICRLNMRGAGDSRALCRQDYHGARGSDLVRFWTWVLRAKPPKVPFAVDRTYFVGTSLSGSILANALAIVDDGDIAPPSDLGGVIGGTGLCFALDTPSTARQLHRATNWPYLQYLLGKIRGLFDGHPDASDAELARIYAARTILDIDELWTAPRNGFSSAFSFYDHASSKYWLPKAKRAFRVIATMDDPWIPPGAFLAADWTNPLLDPRLYSTGGHCGLWEAGHDTQRHFRDALEHLCGLLD